MFESLCDTTLAKCCLKLAPPRNPAKLTLTLTTDGADPGQAMTKRQDILTAGTGSIDLQAFLYKSHVMPPALVVR
ncbi:MAG: hypothetical protein LZF62_480004 [Nitrospira sp.]|nr:MAG: hypothetical protein LZF62_480004 [Nitrospira sp.]